MGGLASAAELELPADHSIGRVVRGFIRQMLGDSDLPGDLIEKATLVASELAANAFLHATPPFALTLGAADGTVRVGIRDSLALPPTVRDYGDLALTGRGLRLVASSSRGWGVVGSDTGKEVWATVGADATDSDLSPMQITNAGPRADPSTGLLAGAGRPDAVTCVVHFVSVPVVDYLSLQERNDAVYRECALLTGMDSAGDSVPPELLVLARRLGDHFARPRDNYRDAVAAAHDRGESTTDLAQSFDPEGATEAVAAAESFLAVMEQLDEFCRKQILLAEPASQAIVDIRRWFVTEIREQLIDSRPPTPFYQS